MIELGMKVKDRITGFTGIVTGVCRYISGCNQALVVPPVKDDGSMVDSAWIDEQRLTALPDPKVVLDNARTPGPDKAPPKR